MFTNSFIFTFSNLFSPNIGFTINDKNSLETEITDVFISENVISYFDHSEKIISEEEPSSSDDFQSTNQTSESYLSQIYDQPDSNIVENEMSTSAISSSSPFEVYSFFTLNEETSYKG